MVLFIVVASAIILTIAYFTYGKFLANSVFKLDDKNPVPSVEMEDGVDYLPAKKGMLLGQHFSAIAAAGPINGPILAAVIYGWAPALLWVILGCIFIGGIHDMGSLVASVRHKAKSITEVVRLNVSQRAWILFMIFVWITLVYVIVAFTDITASSFVGNVTLENGEVVSGAGIASSSAMYLALPIVMGLLMRFGGLKESLAVCIFLPLVGVAIWAGQSLPLALPVADPATAQKVWGVLILVYCLVAAMMPMWLLLQPRGALGGYFLYIALVVAAIGIMFGGYEINYPAFTNLNPDGSLGEHFWTPMFPILFITIACGAVSGFHALISSGTTPKMLANEGQACFIGYGGMLMESFVAIMALVSACIIDPGVYFAMNSPMAVLAPAGTADVVASAAQVVSSWGFSITPDTLNQIASEVGEQSIISRAGGAPTLAVGMAYILHGALGGMMDVAFWYHFAILFEALFILTAVDAGTRAARFMLQDLLGVVSPSLKRTDSLPANLLATAL